MWPPRLWHQRLRAHLLYSRCSATSTIHSRSFVFREPFSSMNYACGCPILTDRIDAASMLCVTCVLCPRVRTRIPPYLGLLSVAFVLNIVLGNPVSCADTIPQLLCTAVDKWKFRPAGSDILCDVQLAQGGEGVAAQEHQWMLLPRTDVRSGALQISPANVAI
jgi:hypothetical protein